MPMSKLIENIEDQIGRERRLDPLRDRVSTSLDQRETGKIRQDMSVQAEHELLFRLGIRYWANQAQQFEARRRAEMSMKDFLYRDVVGRLTHIRSMLDHSDRYALEKAVSDLIDELR